MLTLVAAVFCADAARAATATTLPRREDIKSVGVKVGDHYRSAKPCPSGSCAITNKWDDSVLMMGMIEHWRKYGNGAYKTYTENWANKNSWDLYHDFSGDQRLPNWHNRMTAGYTYLRLLQAGSYGAMVGKVSSNLNSQLALDLAPEKQQLVDYIFPGQTKSSFSWKTVDAEFLALPEWIMMGKHAGNSKYYDRARDLQNYQVNTMGLRDPTTKLWYRDEAHKTMTSPNGQKIIWGRGTGWMAGALAQALEELPTSRPEYATYRTRFTDLMNAVRTRQRADGFWNMNVADPKHYPAPETSATALITYAMAKGIKLGILSGATYRPVAAKAWNAMVATSVRNDGLLGFCQGVGSAPVPPGDPSYPREGSPDTNFCAGAFLLAGTAMHDIAASSGPSPVKTYQAEALATTVSPGDSQTDASNSYANGGLANSANLNATNDYVEFTATNVPNGTYNLRVRYRLDANHGIWQLRTNSENTGTPIDGYDVAPHYAEADLGSVTYSGGPATKKYRFVVTGKSAASGGFRIGIDLISLIAAE